MLKFSDLTFSVLYVGGQTGEGGCQSLKRDGGPVGWKGTRGLTLGLLRDLNIGEGMTTPTLLLEKMK